MKQVIPYSISFVGFEKELISYPLISQNVEKIEKMFLLFSSNSKSVKTYEDVKVDIENKYNIIVEGIMCHDILDFYVNFFQVGKIKDEHGLPVWVNLSSGPSPAINSLFYSFISDNVTYVFVIREEKTCYSFSTTLLEKFRKNMPSLLELLNKLMSEKHLTIPDIMNLRKTSQSTVSRDLNILSNLGFISFQGAGRGNQKKEFFLSERGIKISRLLFDFDEKKEL